MNSRSLINKDINSSGLYVISMEDRLNLCHHNARWPRFRQSMAYWRKRFIGHFRSEEIQGGLLKFHMNSHRLSLVICMHRLIIC